MLKRWITGLVLILVLGISARGATPAAIVSLHGEVNEYTKNLLVKQVNQARRMGAKTVIVDIESYGGLVVSGLEISEFLRGQSDIHTIAYVRRGISAGAMISVSCNEIVMAPTGVLGDCAPIIFDNGGRLTPMPPAERAKEQSPIINDFDANADRNGYDRLLLESMVVVEKTVYWVQNSAGTERRFVDEADYTKLSGQGWRSVPGVPAPIDGAETLLTLQPDLAVKIGLAKSVTASPEVLAADRGFNIIADLSPGVGEKIIEFLNSSVVRGLLVTLLTISLWTVLGAPGHGAAEASAVVSLGLLLGVPLLTGYASWWEILAIVGGLALLAFEVFVFPGHGVSAVVGIILMLGGLLMTFVGPDPGGSFLPSMSSGWDNLRHGAEAITGGVVGSIVLAFWLRKQLPKLPYFNRLILTTTSGGQGAMLHSADVPPANAWPGIGTEGVAITDLRPGGSAEFLDLSVNDRRKVAVISEVGFVDAGAKLVVRESNGNRILVRAVES